MIIVFAIIILAAKVQKNSDMCKKNGIFSFELTLENYFVKKLVNLENL